jgi:hypothetical protein
MNHRVRNADSEEDEQLCSDMEGGALGSKGRDAPDEPEVRRWAFPVLCWWVLRCCKAFVYGALRPCSRPRRSSSACDGTDKKPVVSLGGGRALWCWRAVQTALLAVALLALSLTIYSSLFLAPRDPCGVAVDVENAIASRAIEDSRELPKVIHQQWKTSSVPAKYAAYHAAWRALFPEPEFEHRLWTDASARELIAEHYSWFLPTYDGYPFSIQRADAARYFILHRFGGVYADLDYEPLLSFWHLLPRERVGLIQSPYQYNERVQNSFMSSPQGDPFWLVVFETLTAKAGKPVLQSTGPVLLDSAVLVAAAAERKRGPGADASGAVERFNPVETLPCELFHRIPLGEHDQSPGLTLLHREVLGRWFPMRSCGDYKNPTCQFGKHHNTASYLAETGLIKLIFAA